MAEAEKADVILLVGTTLRLEAPRINTRMRKAGWKKGAKVFAVGPETDLTYKTEWLGDDASVVTKLPAHVTDALKGAERPMLLFGGGALSVPGVHGAGLAPAT